ncbi:MAG: hypothetical protein IKB34_05345 [Clostridia bacterium]|nr:hypothetical protein [Clostridia bacterium]
MFCGSLTTRMSGILFVSCDMGTGEPKIPDYNADIGLVWICPLMQIHTSPMFAWNFHGG